MTVVLKILEQSSVLLKEIKLSDPLIAETFRRSDNAGWYHSAKTLLSLPHMLRRAAVEVQPVNLLDSQGGILLCDRFAVVLESNIRRFLNEKKDITNAFKFVNPCRSHG